MEFLIAFVLQARACGAIKIELAAFTVFFQHFYLVDPALMFPFQFYIDHSA